MSVCRNAAPPSGIPAVILPTVPGRARSLPVMSVNGVKPGGDGDVKLSVLEVAAPSVDPSAGGKAADALATGRALDDVYRKGEVDRMVAEAVPDDYDEVKGRVRQNADALDILEGLVPPQASASNQLADKDFVNSSIATSTATFRGTYNLVADLGLPLDATHAQVAAAVEETLGQSDYDGSDYVFVQVPQDTGHTDAMKQVDRYKCVETGTDPVVKSWEYEWTLNNSSFTAAQWAAIVSGITSGDVAKLGGIEAGAQVNVIETVKVNGTALTPQSKAVDIPVPVFRHDNTVTPTSANGVKSSGVWSAIWGALSALPTGFTSLYDWCVAQLAGKASTADATLTEAKFYPALATYTLPDTALPVTYDGTPPPGWDAAALSLTYDAEDEIVVLEVGSYLACSFNPITGAFKTGDSNLRFGGDGPLRGTFPIVDIVPGAGYVLGSHTDKPLASEAEAEALRTGKQDALTAQQLANIAAVPDKVNASDLEPILFAQYYPEGNVKSAAEFTSGIKYNAPDTVNRTITVKPFCNTGTAANDNSDLVGRVVIPPFVDAQGNGYISDGGTRYKVVGMSDGRSGGNNTNLTAIVVPRTVVSTGSAAFARCTLLTSISLPAATSIRAHAFGGCISLTSVLLPAVTNIASQVFYGCTSLTSVDFGDTPRPSVPTLSGRAFDGVPTSCKIIVPYTQYDEWKAASGWSSLQQEFVRHAEKADKPATFTTGNLAEFDSQGNPVDSGVKASDRLDSTSVAPDFRSGNVDTVYSVGYHITYNGVLYECMVAYTATSSSPTPDQDIYDDSTTSETGHWKATNMTTPDAMLDITALGALRVVSENGEILWQQGYKLAPSSSPDLLNWAGNLFAFAAVPAFDAATRYEIGATVAYDGVAYTFTAVHEQGEWLGTDAELAAQVFSLPDGVPYGRTGDFSLTLDNSVNAASIKVDVSERADMLVKFLIPKGADIDSMFTVAGGAICELYLTQSPIQVDGKPTWKVVRQDVEVVA